MSLQEADGADKAKVRAKAVTTAVAIGAMITSVEATNKDTEAALYETTSTQADGQHPTVVIWVLVAVNPETRDGYRPSVDKVASLVIKNKLP